MPVRAGRLLQRQLGHREEYGGDGVGDARWGKYVHFYFRVWVYILCYRQQSMSRSYEVGEWHNQVRFKDGVVGCWDEDS